MNLEKLKTPLTEIEISELADAVSPVPDLRDKFRRMAFELTTLRSKGANICAKSICYYHLT